MTSGRLKSAASKKPGFYKNICMEKFLVAHGMAILLKIRREISYGSGGLSPPIRVSQKV